MMTIEDITSQEEEDPEIIHARTQDREFWLEKRAARVGRKSIAWFRRINSYLRPDIYETIAGRLEPVYFTEYAFFKWNVGVITCYLCNIRLTKKTVTRDHVVPQCRGGGNEQDNVMPCCKTCNHAKDDMSLLVYLCEARHVV